MPFTPLIEMVLPKCKVTVERKGNVRSTLLSPWGYPLVFQPISQISCCVGVEGLFETARAAGLPLAEVAWLRGRRRGASFPLADLMMSEKGRTLPP